jgi:hypothetical protein
LEKIIFLNQENQGESLAIEKVWAGLAQLVEQLFCKQQVIGSIPVASSIFFIESLFLG